MSDRCDTSSSNGFRINKADGDRAVCIVRGRCWFRFSERKSYLVPIFFTISNAFAGHASRRLVNIAIFSADET